jgi:hypothetical protein
MRSHRQIRRPRSALVPGLWLIVVLLAALVLLIR